MTARARAVAIVALAWLGAACSGRPKAPGGAGASAPEPKTGPAIAIVDLTEGLPEQESTNVLGMSSHTATFDCFVRVAKRLAKDDEVKGVFVRFGGATFGVARATEVGERLAAIRDAGKPVTCHADAFANGTMMAALRGCSKIRIAPAGEVETIGLGLELMYFHELLTDELHLKVDSSRSANTRGSRSRSRATVRATRRARR